MKKFFITALTLFIITALTACTGDSDISITVPQYEDGTADIVHDWTIEELGATIVAAGEFWEDWWHLRGLFALEHFDMPEWEYLPEHYEARIPQHLRYRGVDILLPSSGIKSLSDIRDHLLQFYTEARADSYILENGKHLFFAEYDGVVFVHTARAGTMRIDWNTATHILIEQNGNHAVVKTTALGYDHRGIGEVMPTITQHHTFIDGKIDVTEQSWTWPEANSEVNLVEDNVLDEFTWAISPTFEHQNISFCVCNPLADVDLSDVSSVRAILNDFNNPYDNTVFLCFGHGFTVTKHFFAEDEDVFVKFEGNYSVGDKLTLFTREEFISRPHHTIGADYSNHLYLMRKIDLNKVHVTESIFGNEIIKAYDLSSAYYGKYAVVRGNEFITDFIFDYNIGRANWDTRYTSTQIIRLQLGDRWGILDRNANTILPFIFDDIELISDYFAFAKYDGMYGIINIGTS